MHGNVWEWAADCWHDSYKGAPDDGSAWLEANGGECLIRVVRSDSWSKLPEFSRSANRVGGFTDTQSLNVGFRVLCSDPLKTH